MRLLTYGVLVVAIAAVLQVTARALLITPGMLCCDVGALPATQVIVADMMTARRVTRNNERDRRNGKSRGAGHAAKGRSTRP